MLNRNGGAFEAFPSHSVEARWCNVIYYFLNFVVESVVLSPFFSPAVRDMKD